MLWCKETVDQRLRTLGQDCLFRTVLIVGGVFCSILVAWIGYQSRESLNCLCRSHECFSEFLNIFKFPISIAMATLTLAGFVAVIFRSQQTAIQIQETINQNTFKNYIDHKKQFMEILKGFEEQYEVSFFSKDALYIKLFPFNSPVCVEFESRSLDSEKSALELWINNYNKHVKLFNSLHEEGINQRQLAEWMAHYIVNLFDLHLSFVGQHTYATVSSPFKRYFVDDKKFQVYPKNLNNSFYIIENIFNSLCSFCIPSVQKSITVETAVSFGNSIDIFLKGIHDGRTYG